MPDRGIAGRNPVYPGQGREESAQRVKTAFLLVPMTVLLVLVGWLLFGTTDMYAFLALAFVVNGSAYWFSDRIVLASAQAREVGPEEAPMLHRLADRLALQYRVPKPHARPPETRIRRLRAMAGGMNS